MKVYKSIMPLVIAALISGITLGFVYARAIDLRDTNPTPTPTATATTTPKPVTITNSYHVQENIQNWDNTFTWESWCNYELSDGTKERRKVATFSVQGTIQNRGQMTVQGLCQKPGEELR